MKIVIAPDSFKETMSAPTVAATIAKACREVWPDCECVEVPMADGGEGTTESLVAALDGELVSVDAVDALGRPRKAHYGWIPSQKLAVMEVAETIGIEHISPQERNPRVANTAGVGMMLRDILKRNPQKIIVGLGGSATNDGGWGMLHELGLRLINSAEELIEPQALALAKAAAVSQNKIPTAFSKVEILLASDVSNPLSGGKGATAVFGPQKGVKADEISLFDTALSNWGRIIDTWCGKQVSQTPSAGAAGGLGAAFLGFLGAKTQPGVQVVIENLNLEEKLVGADLVFTGEGGMDFQTKFGKTPWGVMETARKHGIPTIAFAGKIGEGIERLYENGFAAIVPTVRVVTDLETALKNAQQSLYESAKMTCQILNVRKN